MKKMLWVFLILLVTSGCATRVCRERAVYETEVSFMEQAALQSVKHLETFIQTNCACQDNRFLTKECEDAARNILVVKARVPWHKSMMLYNAGILEAKPAEFPALIPSTSTLCPGAVL